MKCILQQEKLCLCSTLQDFNCVAAFPVLFFLFEFELNLLFVCYRYGVHVSNNSYYLCHSPLTIKKIFDRIRTLDNGQVSETHMYDDGSVSSSFPQISALIAIFICGKEAVH